MGFPAAVVAGLGVMQYQQQGAIGKYNQAVQNRNATIAEQEAAMIEKQLEFDIGRFDQQFTQLQAEAKVGIYKSGVDLSGSGLRILRYNAEQAEIQKDVMDYNSKVAVGKKLEEANFARIQGTIYKQQAKLAQIQTASQTGTTLLKIGGYI